MNVLFNICCICVKPTADLQYLHSSSFDNITYYEKLNTSFTDMFLDEKSAQYKICKQCCKDINLVYEFHKKCLTGKEEFEILQAQLSSSENKYSISDVNTNTHSCIDVLENLNINVSEIVKPEVQIRCEINDIDLENNTSNLENNASNLQNNYEDKCVELVNEDSELQTSIKTEISECEIEDLQCTPEINQYEIFQDDHAEEKPKLTTFNSLFCETCNKNFRTQSLFERHNLIHRPTEPNFKCEFCHKTFATKSYLNRHKAIHTITNKFQCDLCEKSYFTTTHLKQHKLSHTDSKAYQCDMCPKRFLTTSHLFRHRKTHNNMNLFECEFCLKNFSCRSYLNHHKLIHLGEKPFVCEICSKSYTHKAHLSQHMKEVHTSHKCFECEVCGRAFPRNSSLTRHKKMHLEDNTSILQAFNTLQENLF